MKRALALALVSLGVLFARAASVPAGYQAVAYIEATGSQFINPNLTVGNSTSLELKLTTSTTTSGEIAFFGRDWNINQYLLTFQGGNFKFYGDGSSLGAIAANRDYTVTASNGTVSVLNESTQAKSTITGKNFSGGSGWNIFAASGGSHMGSYKLRSMKIWEAGGLVRDFHPCYTNTDSGEVIGLYDTVNETFYVNAGTGAFLRGKETENYLWVTGAPGEYGEPICGSLTGYGGRPLTNGIEVAASVPVLSGETATVKYALAGWKLTVCHEDGSRTMTQNSAENVASCTFTPAEGDQATLEWQWSLQCKISVAADSSLSASASALWVALGDTVAISATEDTAPFFAWEGDVPAANKFDRSFTTTVTGPMTVTAVTPDHIYYVAPGGTGDGTAWINAFGTIQAAVTAAKTAGGDAFVCVKAGEFLLTNTVTATAVAPIIIRGGYAGDGIARGGETVVARRDKNDEGIAVQCPVFTFSASTVILDSLVVSNGFSNSEVYGQGVAFKSTCTATVRNCRFVGNGNGDHSSDAHRYGGAVGADKGTLVIANCVFERNSLHSGSSAQVRPCGGAVGALSATVTILGSSFDGNWTQSGHPRDFGGGAIGLRSCSPIVIDNCTFTTNFARRGTGSGGYDYANVYQGGPYGGTIYIEGASSAVITGCTVLGSWNNSYSGVNPDWMWGGTMCFANSTVALVRTVVYAAGESGYASGVSYNNSNGAITLRGGTLAMTNVLHGASFGGWILGNDGGAIDAANCTFAGARGNGNLRCVAYSQTAGSAAFRNCIFSGNAGDDTYIGGGLAPTFTYCFTQAEQSGAYNSTSVPLFGDGIHFHPQSLAGRYTGGWFSGGTWTVDTVHSPTIDAGESAMPFGTEPQPHLYRLNAGYDGGTPVASKSNAGSNPVVEDDVLNIFAYDATDLVSDGATVWADVASTGGGANPAVTVVWGTADAGTNAVGSWTHSKPLGVFGAWDTVSALLTDCAKGKTYYRFVAANEKGTAWSDPVKSFTIGDPPTLAYDTETNPVSHRYRDSARINLTLNDGGMDTTVRVVFWTASDQTAVVTNTTPAVSGAVAVDLVNLNPGTAYVCLAEAVNARGKVTLGQKSFTTHGALEPMMLMVDVTACGRGDGSSWINATTFANALFLAIVAGDEIRMRSGEYLIGDAINIASHAGLAIRGGYSGNGTTRSGETVIYRDIASTYAHRIFYGIASTLVFDSLTIANGSFTTGGGYGQGISLYSACNATFTNCIFRNNGCNNIADSGNTGGAIGAQNGTLKVVDCTFTGNALKSGSGNQNALGGAIGAYGTAVSIERCHFDNNWTQANHPRDYGGGAIGLRNCPSVLIDHCTFTTNFTQRGIGSGGWQWDNINQGGPYGGTIYIQQSPTAVISDCKVIGGWNNSFSPPTPTWPWGGTMFFRDSAVALVRTSVFAGGENQYTSGESYTHANGSIDVRGGTLAMTNVLHAASRHGWALGNNGATVTAVNCTFADARGCNTLASAAYIQHAGTTTFRNCIVWGNAGGFVYAGNVGDAPTITYADSQDGADAANHVISQDPKFLDADAWNYRIKTGSPCANAGDKAGIPRTETDLDGGRRIRGEIDLGCYETLFGGTFLYLR